MDMDFKKAKILSNYLSRDYAETVFRFLVNYKNVSASEIASRLNMHIRPIQEFLETMTLYDIVEKEEVYEKKRTSLLEFQSQFYNPMSKERQTILSSKLFLESILDILSFVFINYNFI